jgi:hypothetical protein
MSATSRRTRRQANEADTQPVIHKGAEDTLVTYDTSAPSERCYSRLSGNGLLCHARKKRFQGLQQGWTGGFPVPWIGAHRGQPFGVQIPWR